jgi:hypothetical protein
MPLYRLGNDAPQIASTAFVAPEAALIGKASPARVVRTHADVARLEDSAASYAERQAVCRTRLERVG